MLFRLSSLPPMFATFGTPCSITESTPIVHDNPSPHHRQPTSGSRGKGASNLSETPHPLPQERQTPTPRDRNATENKPTKPKLTQRKLTQHKHRPLKQHTTDSQEYSAQHTPDASQPQSQSHAPENPSKAHQQYPESASHHKRTSTSASP